MTKRKRRFFPLSPKAGCRFILLMIVAIVGMAAIMVWGFTNLLNPVGETANTLMQALKNEQYDAAYALTSDDFQASISAEKFVSMALEYVTPPSDWQFNSFSVKGIDGRVRGSVVINEQRYNALITMIYEDGGWAINGFDFERYSESDLMPPVVATP